MYVFECGMIGIELDVLGGVPACDGPIERGCIFVMFLLLVMRFWPANRVSGEAVRRGVNGLEGIGDPKVLAEMADGEDGSSLKTSFSEVFGPVLATCQGDADLPSTFSREI